MVGPALLAVLALLRPLVGRVAPLRALAAAALVSGVSLLGFRLAVFLCVLSCGHRWLGWLPFLLAG